MKSVYCAVRTGSLWNGVELTEGELRISVAAIFTSLVCYWNEGPNESGVAFVDSDL